MKRNLLLLAIITLTSSLVCHAQDDYYFEYQEKELSEISNPYTRKHFLGEKMAVQMQLMRENYTYKVEDNVKSIEETVIEKPSIYYSVNKVNKYLKKKVKTEELTKQEAEEILAKVLTITINIRYQNTEKLEEELWATKDPEALKDLYTKRISLGM